MVGGKHWTCILTIDDTENASQAFADNPAAALCLAVLKMLEASDAKQ